MADSFIDGLNAALAAGETSINTEITDIEAQIATLQAELDTKRQELDLIAWIRAGIASFLDGSLFGSILVPAQKTPVGPTEPTTPGITIN